MQPSEPSSPWFPSSTGPMALSYQSQQSGQTWQSFPSPAHTTGSYHLVIYILCVIYSCHTWTLTIPLAQADFLWKATRSAGSAGHPRRTALYHSSHPLSCPSVYCSISQDLCFFKKGRRAMSTNDNWALNPIGCYNQGHVSSTENSSGKKNPKWLSVQGNLNLFIFQCFTGRIFENCQLYFLTSLSLDEATKQ